MNRRRKIIAGFTLIEMMLALVVSVVLFSGLIGVVGQAMDARDSAHDSNALTQQAHFAMQRLERAVGKTRLLLLPTNDNPSTNWLENIREETVPPTTPTDDSTLYTAVLAVTLPADQDLDGDGFSDADDDRDGRIDEDLGQDTSNDQKQGIYLIDDDGDGTVDVGGTIFSDDESVTSDDDPINGVDDDGDGSIDEDPAADNNGDGCAGVCGVDDDGDGSVDEHGADDDDEDGSADEDGYNPVVFYLNNGTLMERTPVPWDESGDGSITGRDFIVEPIAENVTRFRVERLSISAGRDVVVDLMLDLTSPVSGETVSVHTRIRVGAAL